MRIFPLLLILTFYPVTTYARTWEVPTDFASLQDALDASIGGDSIMVLPGTYRENISFQGKNVILASSGGPETTTIEGSNDGPVVMFTDGENNTAAIIGFTITGGSCPDERSGGIWINNESHPLISGNIISINEGKIGGGIGAIGGSRPIIRENLIADNVATSSGGGIYLGDGSNATIHSNVIRNNTSLQWNAGGITVTSSNPLIESNTFVENRGLAGAISCREGGYPVIRNNTFMNNHAEQAGGAIKIGTDTSGLISGNTITGNRAWHAGGGILSFGSSPEIRDNVITNNIAGYEAPEGYGGGIACFSSSTARIENNLIQDNHAVSEGGGITSNSSSPRVRDNTISGNTVYGQSNYGFGGGVFFNDVSMGVLEGNIITDNYCTFAGGGVYVEGEEGFVYTSLILNNTIAGNTSAYDAGGLLCTKNDSTIITGNIIEENNAGHVGGGIMVNYRSRAVIDSNTIRNNQSIDAGGGGIMVIDGSAPLILRNTIEANRAIDGYGGGVNIHSDCAPIVSENTISGNEAIGGGGIRCYKGSVALISRNTILLNTATKGGAVSVDLSSFVIAENNTIVGNTADNGSAIFVNSDSEATILNNILYGNLGDRCIKVGTETDPVISYNCFHLNNRDDLLEEILDEGNIIEDPLFQNVYGCDFTLTEGSPCIDTGDPESPPDPDETRADIGRHFFNQERVGESDDPDLPELPRAYSVLHENFPNPFNPVTTIRFEVGGSPQGGDSDKLELAVYDSRGRKVITLFEEESPESGEYRIIWNGRDRLGRRVSSGVYLYRLSIGPESFTRKMTLLR